MSAKSDSGAEGKVFDLADLTVQPGTYFNPQTEVVVVVDDSGSIDQEVFDKPGYEGAEWVRVSDEVPIDESARDELLEEFETTFHPGATGAPTDTAEDHDLDIDRELEYDDESGEDDEDPGAPADDDDEDSGLEELAL